MTEWLANIPPQYGWTLLGLAAVFTVYRFAVGLLRSFASHRSMTTPFVILRRVLRWLAVVVAGLVALQTMGALQTAWSTVTAAFTLVAIGFVAMWSVLSHATCAVIMMLARPFDVGDTIEFAETPNISGKVVDFTLLFTTLRTDNGDRIQVPNNAFFQRIIKRQPGDVVVSLEEQLDRDEPADAPD